MLAVASARPSTRPTIAGPAPSVAVRKIGSSGVIISLAASFSSDTRPRMTTVRGSAFAGEDCEIMRVTVCGSHERVRFPLGPHSVQP